jgi:hypothetical protein
VLPLIVHAELTLIPSPRLLLAAHPTIVAPAVAKIPMSLLPALHPLMVAPDDVAANPADPLSVEVQSDATHPAPPSVNPLLVLDRAEQ